MANLDPSRDFGVKQEVPERIRQLRPDAKLIYILRDPVERTISAYWHNVRFASERRSLRNAVMQNPAYVWTGRYYQQLQRYLKHFDKADILIIDFRDLVHRPEDLAKKTVRFLGLSDAGVKFILDEPKNSTFAFTHLGRTMKSIFATDSTFYRSTELARSLMPTFAYKLLRSAVLTEPDEISSSDREWLREQFCEDEEQLRELTGIFFQ